MTPNVIYWDVYLRNVSTAREVDANKILSVKLRPCITAVIEIRGNGHPLRLGREGLRVHEWQSIYTPHPTPLIMGPQSPKECMLNALAMKCARH